MDKKNKIIKTLMIIFLPLGILYCVGKNLFNGNFATFMGGVCLFLGGIVVATIWLRPDIIQSIVKFFGG